jgi:RNA polymerase sigma-32 factor
MARVEDTEPAPHDLLKAYLSEIVKHPVLSKEEELELAGRAHRGKDHEAIRKLVISNLRLVVKIALEYHHSYYNILDLVQEGNEGLVRAAWKYDPRKGTRFSTYSSFWIRAYILKHIMDSWSIVKVGTTQNQRRLFYGLKREKKKLEDAGVLPTSCLIASVFGVKTGEVEDMEKRLTHTDVSLDCPLNDEADETLIDTIRVDTNIEETVADRETKEILDRKIAEFRKTLREKELFIFDRRIMTDEPATLQEVGEKFGVSRERVRQLETRVVTKFRDKFGREFERLDL